jgi:hypothetical protein
MCLSHNLDISPSCNLLSPREPSSTFVINHPHSRSDGRTNRSTRASRQNVNASIPYPFPYLTLTRRKADDRSRFLHNMEKQDFASFLILSVAGKAVWLVEMGRSRC